MDTNQPLAQFDDQDEDVVLKNRSTLRIKTSSKLKSMLLKRETLR